MPVESEIAANHLRIERTLPAPRGAVFRAFTDPARMLKWFGPHGFVATFVQLDVRVGGSWRGGMRGPDGKELVASGVYREIVEGRRLVFTYAWESAGARGFETLCCLELSDDEQSTRLIFTQGPFEAPADALDHRAGWGEAFEKLGQAVAP
jgi:uncharacterized protein YndB with AHSA1/START domain